MPTAISRLRSAALAAVLLGVAQGAAARSIPPGGTLVFSDADQAGLCLLAPRKIANARHGTIFAGGVPAPVEVGKAVVTRIAIADGAVEYRHDGSLVGDSVNIFDDCSGIRRVTIEIVPTVCGNGVVEVGEQCDPAVNGGDPCCGADCRLVEAATAVSVACRLRALIAWIRASDIRPTVQRALIAGLERVLFRIEAVESETGRRRAAFLRSAGRRLGSFAARVRSYEGRRAITRAERDYLLTASEPLRSNLAELAGTP